MNNDLLHENNVVSFSGGRTSAYMVYLFEELRKELGINVEYIFADTGAEHPKTYEFIRKVVDNFDIDLTCIRADINPEIGIGSTYRVVSLDECKQDLVPFRATTMKHSTPTLINCHCTDRMKSTPNNKYMNDTYGKLNFKNWLGMRIDESSRMKDVDAQIEMFEIKKRKKPINIDYLGRISDFTKEDVLEFWADMPFDLEIPEWLGNCCFCVKKTNEKIALAARQEPEMAVKFIELINDPEVRPKVDIPTNMMYRNHQSLESIIETFAEFSEEQLIDRIILGKKLDTGSCSESCEATFSMDFEEDL